ncbi:MAG: hypothetical protein JXR64_06475 [Spirochaetales bacterium]|nr:hypothetical protein [Spirochaetales bacterium]
MVNENEITPDVRELTRKATSLFIRSSISNTEPPKLYNLDVEFANTKKNKNLIITGSLVIFILVSLAAAFFVTKYIEIQNSKIPISINAFEDVNLREIFDKAKQYENDMKNAQRDLQDLYSNRDTAIKTLQTNAENAIKLLDTQNSEDKNYRISRIRTELKNNIASEEELWQAEISLVNDRIKSIQDKMDTYDTRILEKAKEQEELINNQQKRFDLEMEESVKYYENKIKELVNEQSREIKELTLTNNNMLETVKYKYEQKIDILENLYNPLPEDDFLFLNNYESAQSPNIVLSSNSINTELFNEGILDKNHIENEINNINQVNSVFKKIKEIPYYNFPSSALLYIEDSYKNTIHEYSNIIAKLTPVIENKNRQIQEQKTALDQLGFFLTNYIQKNKINGIVIDPRGQMIKISIDPIYTITNGMTGYVYRNDSDFIGTVKLYNEGQNQIAEIDQLSNPNRRIEPFDMILLNLKKGDEK